MPIVRGDGPREDPRGTPAVRNSRLPTLSALAIGDGLMRPLPPPCKKQYHYNKIQM